MLEIRRQSGGREEGRKDLQVERLDRHKEVEQLCLLVRGWRPVPLAAVGFHPALLGLLTSPSPLPASLSSSPPLPSPLLL